MLKQERQARILEILRTDGKLIATDLSIALNVSDDTVRRDLRELAEAGKLQRVHGGALPRSSVEMNYAARELQASAGKAAVARAAVKLIENGHVIIMDGGSTVLQVVQRLPADLEATIVTHSPRIAVALAGYPRIEIIVIGGILYKADFLSVGAGTVKAFSSINADLCLQGIWGLHPEVGITYPNFEEVHVKRAMMQSADQVVALASAEKLGTASSFFVAPVNELTHLVTERTVPEEMLKPYRKLGVEILTG
jgi:DeoR/GlpR family transcriptional regulator of sugar metabolism